VGKKRRMSAFTLVELLVVIGIITLLIAMLLPALHKARDAALTVSCAARMRQLNQAVMMFVSDNKGSLPPIWAGSSTNYTFPSWWNTPCIFPWNASSRDQIFNTGYLTPYLGYDLRNYVCPSLEADMGSSTSAQWSYGYNRYLGGAPSSWYALNWSGTWAASQPFKPGQVQESTSYAIFVDMGQIQTTNNAGPPSGSNGIGTGGNKLWFRNDPAAEGGAYASPHAFHLPAGTGMQIHNKSSAPGYTIAGITYPGWRGVVNVAFLDGSVRSIPWQLDRAAPSKPIEGVFVRPEYPSANW
jgi:prepilin-type processing-associated H-X9-DG protein